MTASLTIPRALLLATALFPSTGCSDASDSEGSGTTIKVEATLGPQSGIVRVWDDGEVIANAAEVRVNTTAATPTALGYTVTLPAAVPPGGTLELFVDFADARVKGTGIMPEPAVLTSPTHGATVAAGEDIEVTWTAPADPAHWQVEARAGTLSSAFRIDDGTLRSYAIAGGILSPGEWELGVVAVEDGGFQGDTENGSSLWIRNDAGPWVTITVGDAARR